jgi:DNA polymerase I-like protein with 3'-5' exonuclease and polymerase domains
VIAVADYVLLRSKAEEADAVADLMTRKLVGLDFETTGLDPRRDVVLLTGVDEYIFTGSPEPLRVLVESKDTVKVEYNANFEGMFFEAAGIRQRRVVDPMLGDMLLELGRNSPQGYFSLGQALRRYLYVNHDKTLQTSFVGADPATFVPTHEQLLYLRRDVGYLPALSEAVARRVAGEGLMGTWKLENGYSQALAMMQYHGVLLDVDGYRQELEKINAEFDALEAKVSEALTPSIMEVRRRRYQALKGPEDVWKAQRDVHKARLECLPFDPATDGSKQERRDWINESVRAWKEQNPKPTQAKMNHAPILVTSPDQIFEALNELGIKVENTEKDTLILARAGQSPERQEILKDLAELSVVKKVLANEGAELVDHRLYDGNRLTTRYGQLRTATGRISSSKWRDKGRCAECYVQLIHIDTVEDVTTVTCSGCGRESSAKNFGKQWGANMQNLTPRIKQYVKPGEGRKFVIYDYSQIELRVAAELILRENPHAQDALVRAFRDGLDPHSLTGEDVTGMPYAEFYRRAVTAKEPDMVRLRRGMKVVNFGAAFGFGAAAMAVKIYVDVGDTTPFGGQHIADAQKRLDSFWRVNPTLATLRNRIGDEAISNGFSETLGGRRRYYDTRGLARWQLNGIRRQAVSSRIQGTAADVAKEAQNRIYELAAEYDPEAWLWEATHDEIGVECEDFQAPTWNEIVPEQLTQAFEKYITNIPCELDGGIHDHWSH